MLSEEDAVALIEARHHNPFAVLGLHADAQGRWWLRALLPGALSVSVVDASSQKVLLGLAKRHDEGLFESMIPRRRMRFDYRLKVQWSNGDQGVYADAYSYGALTPREDLQRLAAGTHCRAYEVLGAHPLIVGEGKSAVAGTRFAVWAPNASRVSVVGDFNAWDGRRHMMRLYREAGVCDIFVPHVAIGDHYKFELLDAGGKLLPLKADPYARAAQLRPDTASIVAAMPAVHTSPLRIRDQDAASKAISIYEVHLGSWRRHEDGSFLSWDELAKQLPDYVSGLGFTHLELLPITEHPFDGSWGYQTLGMFAPTARFGSPEGFRRFIDACHAKGLGVILDWVPAHFPLDSHGLANFDGTALYEYADPKEGLHKDWGTAIYNFGRHEVRCFLCSSALYWIERFGIDGLRVDAVASMLYRDYSRSEGEWIPNVHGGRENLEAISLFKWVNDTIRTECDGALMIAEESTSFPGVSRAVDQGGLGFGFKWNLGWMNDTLRYMQEEPIHRSWHHDKLTFGLVYAFSEKFVLPLSHDEVVHGKRSLLGRMPADTWQSFANLRVYFAFMWGHPGKKLLFMGQEFAQTTEWNHDASLPWQLLSDPAHKGVQRLVRDLNQLYTQKSALHALDSSAEGFEWLQADDAQQSVLAWQRRDMASNRLMLVVCNFTPVPRQGYRLGVPVSSGHFAEVLNTDAAVYGGSNAGNLGARLRVEPIAAQGRTHSICLHLPPLAAVFLEACG